METWTNSLQADSPSNTSLFIPRRRTEGTNLIWIYLYIYMPIWIIIHFYRVIDCQKRTINQNIWYSLKSIQVSPEDTRFVASPISWFDFIFKFRLNSHPLLFPACICEKNPPLCLRDSLLSFFLYLSVALGLNSLHFGEKGNRNDILAVVHQYFSFLTTNNIRMRLPVEKVYTTCSTLCELCNQKWK